MPRSPRIPAALVSSPAIARPGTCTSGTTFGTLANRVAAATPGESETFIVIADYQVIADRDDVGARFATVSKTR